MENEGISNTISTLTNRWFTDEFIKNHPSIVERRIKQVIDTDPEVFLNVFNIYAQTEIFPWLKNINKPCLVMTGQNDQGCSPEHNKKMFKELENSVIFFYNKFAKSIF